MEKSLSVTFFAASFRPTAAFFDEEIAILIKRTVNWSQNKWIGLTWWKMEEEEGEEKKAYDLIGFDGDFSIKNRLKWSNSNFTSLNCNLFPVK